GTYWLFFTRGKDSRGIRSLDYNPDLDYYDIWYKQSRSLGGLQRAPEVRISGSDGVTSAQRDIAAVQSEDGKILVFASAGYGYEPQDVEDRGIFTYTYDGIWSGPALITPPDLNGYGMGHIDALGFQGRTWVIFDYGYTLKAISRGSSEEDWTQPALIADMATIGKAIVSDGVLYVAWVPPSGDGVYLSSSGNGIDWDSTEDHVALWPGLLNWDPVLVKDAREFRLFWAPGEIDLPLEDEQFIATTSSPAPMTPESWSDPVRVTRATGNGNSWWDFWPEPIQKGRNEGGALALLYTSERNPDGTSMIDGNIWMEMSIPTWIDR
ncbi:MAG: hypothetical protein LUO97_04120, partial [Methanomicrobiales archaeon]|nr:hypothetical protein [Methanomicrobiales archaeon]